MLCLICTGALGWLAVRSDIRTLTVPDRYQAGLLLLLALAARPAPGEPVWLRALAAAAFAALLIPLGRAGALGGADIKLSFTLAYTLGPETAARIFLLASILFLWIHGVCPRLPRLWRSVGPEGIGACLSCLWRPAELGARRSCLRRAGIPHPRHARVLSDEALSESHAFFPFVAAAAAPAVIRIWTAGPPTIC